MATWEMGGDWVNSEVRSYLRYKEGVLTSSKGIIISLHEEPPTKYRAYNMRTVTSTAQKGVYIHINTTVHYNDEPSEKSPSFPANTLHFAISNNK